MMIDRLKTSVTALSEGIGPRAPGSQGELEAAHYLCAQYKGAGLPRPARHADISAQKVYEKLG
jgi:hypothetical protein